MSVDRKDIDLKNSEVKERAPEWQIGKLSHFIKTTHHGRNGRQFSSQLEFTPNPQGLSSHIDVFLSPEGQSIEITSHTLQNVSLPISIKLESIGNDVVVTKMAVLVKDGELITSVGVEFQKGGDEYVNQYFFDDSGKPAGFRTGMMEAPSWPANREVLITTEMRPHFDALVENFELSSANLAGNLRSAVDILSKSEGLG